MTYEEAEEYINSIPRFAKEKSASGLRQILDRFGNPQDSFSYIHVAGTNGKGSVCAFLDSMLRRAGRRTGLFTSPHLVTTAERMKVDGEMISRGEFTEIFLQLKEVVEERMGEGFSHPTYFEWLYIMAMIWFGRRGIEYGVIETGLGGRLDATNVIRRPAVTVITSISLDHTQILGDTIEKIAAEKAGILKKGVPAVCDASRPEALAVIREAAARLGCPLFEVYPRHIKNILNKGEEIDFSLTDSYNLHYGIKLHTSAVYQVMNSTLAIKTMQVLQAADPRLKDDDGQLIAEGIAGTVWPARFQQLLPGIYVDGAHNPDGARALARTVNESLAGCDIWLLFAAAADKDYKDMIAQLCKIERLRAVIVTQIRGSRCAGTRGAAALFRDHLDIPVQEQADIRQALLTGSSAARGRGALVCAGSLYLAGSIMDVLGDERR